MGRDCRNAARTGTTPRPSNPVGNWFTAHATGAQCPFFFLSCLCGRGSAHYRIFCISAVISGRTRTPGVVYFLSCLRGSPGTGVVHIGADAFLSCLCGSPASRPPRLAYTHFLSCLRGSPANDVAALKRLDFLSCLRGSPGAKSPTCQTCTFLSCLRGSPALRVAVIGSA